MYISVVLADLICLAGELFSAVITVQFSLGAIVLHMLGQFSSQQLQRASVRTRHHVKLTHGQMGL